MKKVLLWLLGIAAALVAALVVLVVGLSVWDKVSEPKIKADRAALAVLSKRAMDNVRRQQFMPESTEFKCFEFATAQSTRETEVSLLFNTRVEGKSYSGWIVYWVRFYGIPQSEEEAWELKQADEYFGDRPVSRSCN